MKTRAAILFVVLLLPSGAVAQSTRPDGNWWRDRSSIQKGAFVIGFFVGTGLGHQFSYWGSLERDKAKGFAEFRRLDSFDEYFTKYVKNVRSDQLVDGLDDFYKDYQNRGILIVDAAWLVLNAIAGTPKDKLNNMIESYRRHAGQTANQ